MIKKRLEIDKKDTWDLEVLFKNQKDWEIQFDELIKESEAIAKLEGTVKEEDESLVNLFSRINSLHRLFDRLSIYAGLKFAEDTTNHIYQELYAKNEFLSTKISVATAFFIQELSSLSNDFLQHIVKDSRFKDYKQIIEKTILLKPHVLSLKEEQLLSKQQIYNDGFQESFSALTDADFSFGLVKTPEQEVEITHGTVSLLLQHKSREVRKETFEKYHTVYNNHLQVLSRLYTSNVQQNCTSANIRNYPSALDASLNPQKIPLSLYHSLVDRARNFFPELHDYYSIIQGQSKLADFSTFDTQVHFFEKPDHDLPYDSAVNLICDALAPLGKDYVAILYKGLSEDRWVDKYESKGKRSGAFSCSVYDSYPYILLNYDPKSDQQVFTLAHEAGHSMHSYYANKANPYALSNYTIFEAEVASTVNEFLLYRHILKNTQDEKYQAFLLWSEIKDFISVFFRQVMFAEFEIHCHEKVEKGEPLSSQYFLDLGKQLLHDYYGPAVNVPDLANIIGLRIPHFYNPFYVFKYATGISAAIDIASKIYAGDKATLSGYFNFLKSGGSRFPLDSLKLAGVDYSNTTPIDNALEDFKNKKNQLKELLKK